MLRTLIPVVTSGLLVWPVAPSRADLVLVSEGAAKATLVTPDTPTEAEALAAERLQHYIAEMTGVSLPLAKEAAAREGACLFIGNTADGSALRPQLSAKQPPAEASLVSVQQDQACLVGKIGRAHV